MVGATISILRPSTSPPKSSAAIFAAVSLPAPGDVGIKPGHVEDAAEFERRFCLRQGGVADNASTDARTPENIRFMKASLRTGRIRCGLTSVAAIMPEASQQRQGARAQRAVHVVRLCAVTGIFRKAEWCEHRTLLLEHDDRHRAFRVTPTAPSPAHG